MTERRHILVVSGSRADYGLLYWPMKLIGAEPAFRLSVAVTGMHLAEEFGHTADELERDGFVIAARVPVLGAEDSSAEVARAIGRGVIGFTDAFQTLKPDLVLLLGDRFEIFAAAQAAFVLKIPIAHLCGGDVTSGALDDAFRHAMTKMAGLHFPTNEAAARRLRQLGEMPERIHLAGSTGLDFLLHLPKLDRATLAAELGHELAERFLLVTLHPATLDPVPAAAQAKALLAALAGLPGDLGIVFTLSNADAEGQTINDLIRVFVKKRPGAHAHTSLGTARYLNAMRHAAAIVGNSSSGLYEAPSLDVPSVNIGRRQAGRLRARSVIDCSPDEGAIRAAIDKALLMRPSGTINPYGDGKSSERIVAALKAIPDWSGLIHKNFVEFD
jgi:UDP-hydrolysing UDP-N-acetyl-D-glucosamine 2-epimerase